MPMQGRTPDLNERLIPLGVTLLYTIGLAILSLTPDRADPGGSAFVWLVHITPTMLQKTLHVVFYAGLTVLWVWTIRASMAVRLAAAFCIAVAFGVLLEWLQVYVPGRFGSLMDIIVNAVGALIGVAIGSKEAARLDRSRRNLSRAR